MMFRSTFSRLGLAAAAMIAYGAATAGTAMAGSAYSCDSYARQWANSQSKTTDNVVTGGIGGALGGALLGGIIGGRHKIDNGAAVGAGLGALTGAVKSSGQWDRNYRLAYDDCMSNQAQGGGYQPVYRQQPSYQPAYQPSYAPPEGSREWYAYCAEKYRSFNPNTGLYRSTDGRYRACR